MSNKILYMRINNRDSHGSLLIGSESGIVVINRKLSSITNNTVIKDATVAESQEEVTLLWQKQIHDNYMRRRTKGGDASNSRNSIMGYVR